MDTELRHFAYLARYNKTANEQLLRHLSSLAPAELSKARGSFFGSIQGLLDHVIMCDINWLRRFRLLFPESGVLRRPRLDPPGCAWQSFSFPDYADFKRERSGVDAIFVDWIAQADSSRFGQVLAYPDSHGKPMRYYLRDAMDHVFNHQTHHRGQISQILDELKVEHDFSNLIGVADIPPAE